MNQQQTGSLSDVAVLETERGTFPAYPHYKASDWKWFSDIPAHWDATRLGRLGAFSGSGIDKKSKETETSVRMVNYTDVYGNNRHAIWGGDHLMQTTAPSWKAREHSLQRGDILFTPSSETCADIGVSAVVMAELPHTVYSYHLVRFRPWVSLDLSFEKYFCNSTPVLSYFSSVCQGTTRMTLTRGDFKRAPVVIPPLEEQQSIAHFLDCETAEIDDLIAKKNRLIQLLDEKRTALITQAVTKGLDPDVPMKDSGVEWLGEIPNPWEVTRVRRVAKVIDCKHKTPDYVEDGFPLVSTTEVRPGVLDLTGCTRFVAREDYEDMIEGPRRPRRGDIIYSRNASLGHAALVETDEEFCMGQDVVLIRSDGIRPEFLTYQLNSPVATCQVEAVGVGSTFSRINVATIRDLIVIDAPPADQDLIVTELDAATRRIRVTQRLASAAVSRLREYRSALITAAVTGKIDVREHAA